MVARDRDLKFVPVAFLVATWVFALAFSIVAVVLSFH